MDPVVGNEDIAEIEVLLSQESSPQTKGAFEFAVPEIDSLKVEVFKWTEKGQKRLYRDTYANTLGKKISLNCADYRLLASYGDSLATGFDKAYFEGIADFSLSPQESQVVETVVKVSNVRASLVFGENLVYDYPEFYAVVKSVTKGGKKRTLKFYSDETRAGFVPLGQVYLELYVKIAGEWKYFCSEAVEAEAGDDIVFTVDTKRLESEVNFNLTIAQPDEKPKVVQLTQSVFPADSPEIDENEFGGSLVVTEGDATREDLKLDLVAEGEISECWLSVRSEYLSRAGLPSEIDLADEQMSSEIAALLESTGVSWMKSMKGRKFAYVDFSGVTRFLSSVQCDPENMYEATFSVRLVDSRHGVEGSAHHGLVQTGSMTFIQGVPAPTISVSGFEQPIYVMEAVDTETGPLKVSLNAKGKIAKCVLSVESPYLNALGIPASVNLIDADANLKSLLNSVGITWTDALLGSINAEVDLSGVVDFMEENQYSQSKGYDFAKFSISVENSQSREGNIKECEAPIGQLAWTIPSSPSATGNYVDIDVRARRLENYSTVLAQGNFSEWRLQFSHDGKTWNDMPSVLNNNILLCERVTGLASSASAGVKHDVRAIYHNNPDIAYPLSSFTTEAAAQVPNSGFETWQSAKYEYYLDKIPFVGGGNNTSRTWYLPWTSDADRYWDVNSRKTMPANTTPKEQDFKVFPAVSYSVDTPDGSGASAQMVGVYVSNMATSSSDGDGIGGTLGGLVSGITQTVATAAGEIFIGKADNSGNHSSEGCAFGSRPDKLRFQYKYSPKNNENYLVTIWLKDSEENIIAEAEMTGGGASSWTQTELDLVYDDTYNVRPSTIYMCFRAASCADADVYHDRNVTIEMAGTNFKGHLGSILKIDNKDDRICHP